jgi:hypothetical protein
MLARPRLEIFMLGFTTPGLKTEHGQVGLLKVYCRSLTSHLEPFRLRLVPCLLAKRDGENY